jgi:PhzF family phenazine biosynthesis protein
MFVNRIAAFTENGQGGNPAGVVLVDTLPSRVKMQQLAVEVGYSETVFSAYDGNMWQTRYFSPESEVPFCGHATIALGAVFAREKGNGTYRLELQNGSIEVEARKKGEGYHSTLKSLPTRNSVVPEIVLNEALELFGYEPADLDSKLPVRMMHAGADHLHLPLRTRASLSAMKYNLSNGRSFMNKHSFVTVAFTWREADNLFHTRNAFASGGVLEDPATGAAAAAFVGMLRDEGLCPHQEIIILQGADMGSPSRITVQFDKHHGTPVSVSGESTRID